MTAVSPASNGQRVRFEDEPIVLPGRSETEANCEIIERTLSFNCVSGGVITGTWRGIVIDELLERVSVPAETTHLVVTAADDHTVCLPIIDLTDALLALSRVDSSGNEERKGTPRIVGPSLDGPRAIKNVVRIEPVTLSPDRSPTELETYNHT